MRIKVQACGVCHSDALTKEGQWPGIQYPRVPGHEVAGVSMKWARVFPRGRWGSVWASAGMAARTARVPRAGAETFAIAGT